MKILHTADWHLCDKLGRNDRTRDLQVRVEQVARLCQEHAVDVLLIAGDLFSEQATVDDMTAALNHIHDTFRDFFARGGAILAITGNHDRDGKINMVRAGMTLAAPVADADGTLPGGRMYLVNTREVVTLRDAAGQHVQFVLVPYPFASRYQLSATQFRSKEEEYQLLHDAVSTWVQQQSATLNPAWPAVLSAHLHVRGAQVHSLYKLTEREDVVFNLAELNREWAYIALGHIHLPQQIGGASNVQYPGSLDRLDFGEVHDDHGVTLFEIKDNQAGTPIRLPLTPTPFHTITLEDPELELETLAERYPDAATALVRFVITPPPSSLSRDEVVRQLKKLFPRWHEFKWTDALVAPESTPARFDARTGFEETVRKHLETKLAEHAQKDALLNLAQSFIHQVRDA